jgi:transcriptional regulator with XRE-family HTH domain
MLAKYGKVSVTEQTVSGWLNGTFMPRLRNQRALAIVLGVDLSTLLAEDKPQQVREARASWGGLSGKDQLAIQEYASLPAAYRKLIRELIAALASEALRQKS